MANISIGLSRKSIAYVRQVRRRLDADKIYEGILNIMDRQGSLTAGYITKNFLSGQRLNRITGNLARSVVGRGEKYQGLPAMRVGVLAGPALGYAAINELGTQDLNPESPFSQDRNGTPLTGRRPRYYLRDGMQWGVIGLSEKIEEYLVKRFDDTSNQIFS